MKNVLLVGGKGFVGTAMRKCIPMDTTVSIYSRTCGTLNGKWTHIVNLATGCSPEENIEITAKLKHMADDSGARLLLASSGAAWERNQYGAMNALREEICRGAVIARLYSFIGRGLTSEHAVKQFLDSASQGKNVVITGSGNVVRSYLHSSELARMMWSHLLDSDPGIYEIGSSVPVTIKKLAETVAEVYNVDVQILHGDDGARLKYLPVNGVVPEIDLKSCIKIEQNEWNWH
jgi:nucleoside-diphosphate-sugar epimerase